MLSAAQILSAKAVRGLGKIFREVGLDIDKLALRFRDTEHFLQPLSQHMPVVNFGHKQVTIAKNVFVAPNATVAGNVSLQPGTSVWYDAVVRTTQHAEVSIGKGTNIQDRAVITADVNPEDWEPRHVHIGEGVTIGHGATLCSCRVHDNVMIGQGSVVLEGSEVKKNSIIAAGAVVRPKVVVGEGELWAGNPAKFVRKTTEAEIAHLKTAATNYVIRSQEHLSQFAVSSEDYLAHAARS